MHEHGIFNDLHRPLLAPVSLEIYDFYKNKLFPLANRKSEQHKNFSSRF